MSATPGTAPSFSPQQPVTTLAVPIDQPDERAMPFAAWLAELWDLPIRLLHLPGRPRSGHVDFSLDQVTADARLRWPNLRIDAERLEGDEVAATIVGAAGSDSLLIVATDNANAWSFKNSVAERLVDRIESPAILVGTRADQPNPGGDVVVAFDGRPAAESALAAAASLALALGRSLVIVQVVPKAIGPGDERPPAPDLELDRRVEGLDPRIGARWDVIESNDPVTAIESFADRLGASFVVAAARGRTDVTRTTMSSITMGLVANAGRPVLVVHH